jgi:hypothetical protein
MIKSIAFSRKHGLNSVNSLRYHLKILSGVFSAKVGRKDIFKQTIGNENLNKISNNKGIILVNCLLFVYF